MNRFHLEKIGDVVKAIRDTVRQPWRIMEICGGQTHAIARYGIEELLPPEITLLHGPGCPVCVTPNSTIEAALEIAATPGVIFTSFGDMLRVPGKHSDLLSLRSRGADVRILYSPLDAVMLAQESPEKEVVFLSVGFETTAPAHALAVTEAKRKKLRNFSILPSLFTVPPAIEAIVADPDCHIDGFLAAGHVCTVEGCIPYEQLAKKWQISITVTGFEAMELLLGIYHEIVLLESKRHTLYNAYPNMVRREGNPRAKAATEAVFEPCDQTWRGLGTLPMSGLKLRKEFEPFDAFTRFKINGNPTEAPDKCCAGKVLKGIITPDQCPMFATDCTAEHPLGAPMVSTEGACAAYYRYRR